MSAESRPPIGIGRERQFEVYVGGARGARPRVPVSVERLEQRAQDVMSAEAFAYVAGGAGTEETMRENRAAFERWRIVPRVLHDVSVRDTTIELFGTRLPSPFVLSPIGVLEMAHRDADLAVARAAAAEGVPMTFSNQASRPMEDCARELGDAPHWFQLYWSTSNDLVESLVGRAEACGCTAVVLTLDTTMLGWRIRDLDLAYLPFLRGKGIAQYTSDPVFVEQLRETLLEEAPPTGRVTPSALRTLWQMVSAYPGPRLRNLRSGEARAAVRRFVEIYSRPSLTWEDLAFLRERTKLPILLKGVLSGADASAAVEHGMDGIVVSNHGGRQVDGSIATMDALPSVVAAVGAACRSCSTAACARAPTRSARSRSARPRSASVGRTSGVSRSPARTAYARSCGTSARTSTSRSGSPGYASIADLTPDSVTRAV